MSAVGSILSNDGALDALNSMAQSTNTTNTLEAELSSGKSINSPADNPAGYITAQGFTSQLNGLNQALSNANQGISLLQTAQGAINQQTSLVQSLNSIAVQAANGTQTPAEAQSLQGVVSQLVGQVNTIADQTQFNNINLLDGTFSGVNFQVGANEGQTISLSIAGTSANALGMYASKDSGAATPMFGSTAAKGSQSVYKGSAAGAYSGTAGALTINGSNGTSSGITVAATDSAQSIAAKINAQTDTTNVAAQATTVATITLGSSGSTFAFSLGNGVGSKAGATNTVAISATGGSDLVTAINDNTSKTGVTASLNNGVLTLTDATGDNITITNQTSGILKDIDGGAGSMKGTSTTPASGMFQGKVQIQSDQSFSVTNGADIGLGTSATLNALSGINVSTSTGAQNAINVIKYALQGLGADGGQLGAVQQRLQANVNNNETTVQNLTSALSVVQDANIPQVSEQLTEQQVLQAAGVSALKNSTTLQQMYAQLLP